MNKRRGAVVVVLLIVAVLAGLWWVRRQMFPGLSGEGWVSVDDAFLAWGVPKRLDDEERELVRRSYALQHGASATVFELNAWWLEPDRRETPPRSARWVAVVEPQVIDPDSYTGTSASGALLVSGVLSATGYSIESEAILADDGRHTFNLWIVRSKFHRLPLVVVGDHAFVWAQDYHVVRIYEVIPDSSRLVKRWMGGAFQSQGNGMNKIVALRFSLKALLSGRGNTILAEWRTQEAVGDQSQGPREIQNGKLQITYAWAESVQAYVAVSQTPSGLRAEDCWSHVLTHTATGTFINP